VLAEKGKDLAVLSGLAFVVLVAAFMTEMPRLDLVHVGLFGLAAGGLLVALYLGGHRHRGAPAVAVVVGLPIGVVLTYRGWGDFSATGFLMAWAGTSGFLLAWHGVRKLLAVGPQRRRGHSI
jgi:hypothetical protein